MNKAVAPPGEARPDFDIFLAVAEKLGCREKLFPGWACAEEPFSEWRPRFERQACAIIPESLMNRSRERGDSMAVPRGWPTFPPSVCRRDNSQTPNAAAKLIAAHWEPFPEQPTREPSVRSQYRTHRGALAHTHQDARGPDPGTSFAARMAGDESARRQRASGCAVTTAWMWSRSAGAFIGVELRLTEIIAPGQVFMPFHSSETNVNEVTQSAFDPISREPNYKQCAVRVTVPSADTAGGR